MQSELKRIIDQISRDRGFDKQLLIEAIEEAVQSAARKKLGSRRDFDVRFNEEFGEVEVFQFRKVVEEVEDEQTEIALEEALLLNPDAQLNDDIGEKMENITDLGRIAAQSAKQVIIHKLKDAEREVIYSMFKDRLGEVVSGIVQRFDRGNMIVNLGRTEAILPKDQQIPKRSFKQGDRIRAYLMEVRQTSRDSQLILSRTCDEFLAKLFQMEVPEIAEGIVRVMGVSREPGFRAKIAVSSSESDVDPVGACVGMKGSRVQNVVQELQGERIDIVTWSPDPAKYVYNALAPAHVSMVQVDEENHSLLAVVPNDQLSLAIGRQGQNVRLASKLLGWRIDVKSEQRYTNLEDLGYQSLLALDGVDESLADQIVAKGICSAADFASRGVDEIAAIRSIDHDFAEMLLRAARTATGVSERIRPVREEVEEAPTEPADSDEQGGVDGGLTETESTEETAVDIVQNEETDEIETDETEIDETETDETKVETDDDQTDDGEVLPAHKE